MSETTKIRAALDELLAQRAVVDAAIHALVPVAGLAADEAVALVASLGGVTPAPAAAARGQAMGRDLTEAMRGAPRVPAAKAKAARSTTRPTTASTGARERVLTALTTAGEPVSLADLSGATKLAKPAVKYHLRALMKAGTVTATGSTANRRFAAAA